MPTIKKRPATTAVPFPRTINPGVNSVKVNFDDFTQEPVGIKLTETKIKTDLISLTSERPFVA